MTLENGSDMTNAPESSHDQDASAGDVSGVGGDPGPESHQGSGEPPISEEPQESQDPKLSQAWAALMRREKAVTMREKQARERIRSDPEFAEFQRFKQARQKSDDPDALLESFGWDYDRLIRHKMGEKEKEPSTEEKLLQRIDKLEARLADKEKKEQEHTQNQTKAAALQYIDRQIDEAGDDFELVRLHKATEIVYDVIREHFDKTKKEIGEGEVLEVREAAKLVEAWLETEVDKLTTSKKIRSRFGASEPSNKSEPGPQDTPPVPVKEAAPKTISSRAIQSGSVPSHDGDDYVSYWDDETSRREIAKKWKEGHYDRR